MSRNLNQRRRIITGWFACSFVMAFCLYAIESDARVKAPEKPVPRQWSTLQPGKEYLCIEVKIATTEKALRKTYDRLNRYDDVRIEKAGDAYAIMVGFFENQREARETLELIKPALQNAGIRPCIYDSARIRKMRARPVTIIASAEPEAAPPDLKSQETEPPAPPTEGQKQATVEKPSDGGPKPLDARQESAVSPGPSTALEERAAALPPAAKTAVEKPPDKIRKNVIESWYSREYLTDDYGTWDTLNLMYKRKETGLTYFFGTAGFARREKNAMLFNAGAYKDWHERFYTYTSVAAGTYSDYLPKIRLDQDFNLKFGEKRNFVWTVGGTVIDYYVDHRDYIVSTGLMAYLDKFVLSYRLFWNTSMPGSVTSFSHTFGIEYGTEGDMRTSLIYSFGKQAYQATNLVLPQDVENNSQGVTLKHRHWIKDGFGVFGELGYFNLENGYNKYGIGMGVFKEF